MIGPNRTTAKMCGSLPIYSLYGLHNFSMFMLIFLLPGQGIRLHGCGTGGTKKLSL